MYVYLCMYVCMYMTTITKKIMDGFVPNFMERLVGEREDQVRVSLRSVEGCGSNGDYLHFILLIVGVACCQVLATKTIKFRFRGELYSLRVLSI